MIKSKSKYNNIKYLGKRYNNFKIIDFVLDENGRFVFKCLCKCQENRDNPVYNLILPSHLILGRSKSCGCLKGSKNLEQIGKVFGCLKILNIEEGKKNIIDGAQAICECQICKKIVKFPIRHILDKRIQTCGDMECKKIFGNTRSKYRNIQYIGKEYGYLRVLEIYPVNKKDKHVFWKCQCLRDGNIVRVKASTVVRGNNLSCGCLISIGEVYIKEILDDNHIVYKKNFLLMI